MHMIMFVLDDPHKLDTVLEAWHNVGVNGVTIIQTSGLHRRRARVLGVRYAFALPQAIDRLAEDHYTLFAAVPDVESIQACLHAAEEVVGDLNEPHTGLFTAWELSTAKGITNHVMDSEADQ